MTERFEEKCVDYTVPLIARIILLFKTTSLRVRTRKYNLSQHHTGKLTNLRQVVRKPAAKFKVSRREASAPLFRSHL